ncbi:type VI secretion system baseplate subunit TssE [Stutzerimonas stutzeri]|uniref:type VI secretion system baseplate subunit TssE n=1 Tax=Stutzerimonas stutzeri TaxID=316 RepID=UPI001C2E8525|nr:type VI secretion system baseplate subunit TssE [Stutzerimonas stutzeri]
MKGYGSLFERLGSEAGQRAGWSHEVAAMASVAAHLAKMLSTRAGSVQTLPDYGLPDLNDMRLSLHDSLQQARIAIERFIEAYEPRLTQVRVVSLPRTQDPLRQTFAIDGLLEMDGVKRQVSFSASLDGSGQVKVNPGASHVR